MKKNLLYLMILGALLVPTTAVKAENTACVLKVNEKGEIINQEEYDACIERFRILDEYDPKG